MAVYDKYGTRIDEGSASFPDYDLTVIGVNHRGYSTVAPENTLPAYKLSKQMGFNYVEADVCFTSDGVPVLLHDPSINRTSNGSGMIYNLTFEEVRTYDFGSWKSSEYAGTKIPSLAEFLQLCKDIMLNPWIELKQNSNYSQAQIESIVDMVNAYGLRKNVTYISFTKSFLTYVKNYDDEAPLVYLNTTPSTSDISDCNDLKTTKNKVAYGTNYTNLTDAICEAYAAAKIPISVWTVDSGSDLMGLNPYVSMVTSNSLIAGKVLCESVLGPIGPSTPIGGGSVDQYDLNYNQFTNYAALSFMKNGTALSTIRADKKPKSTSNNLVTSSGAYNIAESMARWTVDRTYKNTNPNMHVGRAIEINPFTLYDCGYLDTLSMSFPPSTVPSDQVVYEQEYRVRFTITDENPTITLPAGVTMEAGFTPTNGSTYEIHIYDKYARYVEF